mmetsp:Transcript_13830/g.43534  ORF Transcript_13830/g.43534 Transcript_13830/m.43534 type:complete len:253 (-) Transcript_13830:628-1386(-)
MRPCHRVRSYRQVRHRVSVVVAHVDELVTSCTENGRNDHAWQPRCLRQVVQRSCTLVVAHTQVHASFAPETRDRASRVLSQPHHQRGSAQSILNVQVARGRLTPLAQQQLKTPHKVAEARRRTVQHPTCLLFGGGDHHAHMQGCGAGDNQSRASISRWRQAVGRGDATSEQVSDCRLVASNDGTAERTTLVRHERSLGRLPLLFEQPDDGVQVQLPSNFLGRFTLVVARRHLGPNLNKFDAHVRLAAPHGSM